MADAPAWQLTLASVITVGGFVVNGGIALFNAQRTSAGKRLDHFNNVIRKPIEQNLAKIDVCYDDAEDFIVDHTDAPCTVKELSRNFHRARRALERTLQDAQNSNLVPGEDWMRMQDDECDRAVDFLGAALIAFGQGDIPKTKDLLAQFRAQIYSLRRRVQDKVD